MFIKLRKIFQTRELNEKKTLHLLPDIKVNSIINFYLVKKKKNREYNLVKKKEKYEWREVLGIVLYFHNSYSRRCNNV